MDTPSVADFSLFINRQIKGQEQIESSLWRLEALIAVAVLTDDFYTLPARILHNYFSVAGDLIEEAAKVNEANLDQLLKLERQQGLNI